MPQAARKGSRRGVLSKTLIGATLLLFGYVCYSSSQILAHTNALNPDPRPPVLPPKPPDRPPVGRLPRGKTKAHSAKTAFPLKLSPAPTAVLAHAQPLTAAAPSTPPKAAPSAPPSATPPSTTAPSAAPSAAVQSAAVQPMAGAGPMLVIGVLGWGSEGSLRALVDLLVPLSNDPFTANTKVVLQPSSAEQHAQALQTLQGHPKLRTQLVLNSPVADQAAALRSVLSQQGQHTLLVQRGQQVCALMLEALFYLLPKAAAVRPDWKVLRAGLGGLLLRGSGFAGLLEAVGEPHQLQGWLAEHQSLKYRYSLLKGSGTEQCFLDQGAALGFADECGQQDISPCRGALAAVDFSGHCQPWE